MIVPQCPHLSVDQIVLIALRQSSPAGYEVQ